MAIEIKPLQCPSCGNSANVAARELKFGYEFACSHCRTVSIVVINDQLYIPKSGEHVCPSCGRVASKTARFCQCGKSLVRGCRKCRAETFVDNKICDNCGWPCDIDPHGIDGLRRVLDGLSPLDNDAYYAITKLGPSAKEMIPLLIEQGSRKYTTFCDSSPEWEALAAIGAGAVSAIGEFLRSPLHRAQTPRTYWTEIAAIRTLGKIAPPAVPTFVEFLHTVSDYTLCHTALEEAAKIMKAFPESRAPIVAEITALVRNKFPAIKFGFQSIEFYNGKVYWQGLESSALRALEDVGPSAIPAIMCCFEREEDQGGLSNLAWMLRRIGEPAIAALRPFAGFFNLSQRGKLAKLTIMHIRDPSTYDP